jgi:hypothetical protein
MCVLQWLNWDSNKKPAVLSGGQDQSEIVFVSSSVPSALLNKEQANNNVEQSKSAGRPGDSGELHRKLSRKPAHTRSPAGRKHNHALSPAWTVLTTHFYTLLAERKRTVTHFARFF